MIKRLIFEIDGTLITGVTFDEAIKNSLMAHGLFSEENLQKYINAISTYEDENYQYEEKKYLQHFSHALGTKIDKDFLNIHFKNLEIYAVPDEINKELISTIEQLCKKYELVILTNYFEQPQKNRLKKIGISDYFSEFYGEKVIKPYKQAFLDAIRLT